MRHKILGYVFITAVVASIVSVGYYWQVSNQPISEFFFPQIKQGQKAEPYTNTEFGFQFNYDKKYKLDVSGSQANFFKHEAKSLVSASIPKSFYPKTNFGSANLTVAIQPHSQKSSCSVSAKTVEVNGTTFHVSEQDGAAAGTHYQTKI